MLYLETMKAIACQAGRKHIVMPGPDGAPPARLTIYRSDP